VFIRKQRRRGAPKKNREHTPTHSTPPENPTHQRNSRSASAEQEKLDIDETTPHTTNPTHHTIHPPSNRFKQRHRNADAIAEFNGRGSEES